MQTKTKQQLRWCIGAGVVLIAMFCGIGHAPLAAQSMGMGSSFAPATINPQTQKLLEPITPLIDQNTFLVGHIDLRLFEPNTFGENLSQTATKILLALKKDPQLSKKLDLREDGGINEQWQSVFINIQSVLQQLQQRVEALREAGCNDVYLLANSKIMLTVPVQVVYVVPGGNVDAVKNALNFPEESEIGWVYEQRGDIVIGNLVTPFSAPRNEENQMGARVSLVQNFIRPMVRPELVAGLEKIKNAPCKFVLAPDGVVFGLAQTSLYGYPMHYYGGMGSLFISSMVQSVSVIEKGLDWLALGIDPAKNVLALTVQAKSPEAAKQLADLCVSLKVRAEFFVKMQSLNNGGNRYSPYNNDPSEFVSCLLDLAMFLMPEAKGDQLQLVVNEKKIEEFAQVLTKSYTNVVLPSRENQNRMQCTNNMKQIVLAMHNYHDAHKAFPAVYATNKEGKPMHSWRVALLPFIEQTAVYEQIRHNEPWDSEWNKQFHKMDIRAYQCPSAKNPEPGMTNYSIITGKHERFMTPFTEPNKWQGMASITDGTSNTFAIVERKEPVCWMDPTQEITLEEIMTAMKIEDTGVGSAHKGGFNFAMVDGSVHFWNLAKYSMGVFQAMATCNGGESMTLP